METKKLYKAPEIELIKLDNEISLAMESNPEDELAPLEPGGNGWNAQSGASPDPFKDQMG